MLAISTFHSPRRDWVCLVRVSRHYRWPLLSISTHTKTLVNLNIVIVNNTHQLRVIKNRYIDYRNIHNAMCHLTWEFIRVWYILQLYIIFYLQLQLLLICLCNLRIKMFNVLILANHKLCWVTQLLLWLTNNCFPYSTLFPLQRDHWVKGHHRC